MRHNTVKLKKDLEGQEDGLQPDSNHHQGGGRGLITPGTIQPPETRSNPPKIDEKSTKTKKSEEISDEINKGGNISTNNDAPKTTDRIDGNKTTTNQQGSAQAPEPHPRPRQPRH